VGHTWVEQTGEPALGLTSDSETGVVEEGFAAIAELPACEGGEPARRDRSLRATGGGRSVATA
jgi:hypothetical protein